MQLKKRLLIVIGLILLLGIGGKMYMDHQKVKEQEAEEEKIEAERMSVIALKERYANIQKVEFEKSSYDDVTGSYGMFVKLTNENGESANISYSYWKEQKEVGLTILINRKVQFKGITTKKVQVIYSNKEEGEV